MPPEPKPPGPKPPPARTSPPFQYGKPEKTNWLRIFLLSAFVVIGIGAIIWMIAANPRQHALNCREDTGAGLWSAMGRCTEE